MIEVEKGFFSFQGGNQMWHHLVVKAFKSLLHPISKLAHTTLGSSKIKNKKLTLSKVGIGREISIF